MKKKNNSSVGRSWSEVRPQIFTKEEIRKRFESGADR